LNIFCLIKKWNEFKSHLEPRLQAGLGNFNITNDTQSPFMVLNCRLIHTPTLKHQTNAATKSPYVFLIRTMTLANKILEQI